MSRLKPIEGTIHFDGAMSKRGWALNKMCYSFNEADNRDAFKADEAGYCARFGLDEAQTRAVLERDIIGLLENGGSIYYLAKLAGIEGWNMQDVGALQTGMSVDEFKAMLVRRGRGED